MIVLVMVCVGYYGIGVGWVRTFQLLILNKGVCC